MNGNVTKEGITADLEALAGNGLAGAMMFDASCHIPKGPITFGTHEYFDCIRHAAKEAKRLGLVLGIANGTGWANSGGPWVTPAESMKYTTCSETPVKGPVHFDAVLPRRMDDNGFYADIAVLAVKGIGRRMQADVTTVENAPDAMSRHDEAEFTVRSTKGNVATVTVNGKTFRTLWKPPFRIDITDAPKRAQRPIVFDIEVRVTNRWPNRLIGEDMLPEDERTTRTSWKHWSKGDKLLDSGLLGPVKLEVLW